MLEHAQALHNREFTPLPDKIVHRVAAKERRVEPRRATSPVGKLYHALLGDKRTYSLDNEQQACVRYATQAPGRIKAIYGAAGTTKTSVVAAIAEAYQKAGWKTYGTALSGVAAKNLAEKTGVESDTVKMTLMRLYPTTAGLAKHHVQQLWRAARSMPTYKFDRLQLNSKSVLFVDETSMIGTRDVALLTKA